LSEQYIFVHFVTNGNINQMGCVISTDLIM